MFSLGTSLFPGQFCAAWKEIAVGCCITPRVQKCLGDHGVQRSSPGHRVILWMSTLLCHSQELGICCGCVWFRHILERLAPQQQLLLSFLRACFWYKYLYKRGCGCTWYSAGGWLGSEAVSYCLHVTCLFSSLCLGLAWNIIHTLETAFCLRITVKGQRRGGMGNEVKHICFRDIKVLMEVRN